MLEKFNLERWYRMFVYLGALIFFPALFMALGDETVSVFKGITMLFGAGFFFFGIGEWINHPPHREGRGGGTFFGPGFTRVAHPGGLFLDGVGIVLLILASALFVKVFCPWLAAQF